MDNSFAPMQTGFGRPHENPVDMWNQPTNDGYSNATDNWPGSYNQGGWMNQE